MGFVDDDDRNLALKLNKLGEGGAQGGDLSGSTEGHGLIKGGQPLTIQSGWGS